MCTDLQWNELAQSVVPCRNCKQCRARRVDDLVGRCIAESQIAATTVAVTLTYQGDGMNSVVLHYPDFQRFIKRLRASGVHVRYLVAGEYGSKKNRAHWHAILFFKEPQDLPQMESRQAWQPWTNKREGRGFVYFQQPDYDGFRYVLKYVLKDQDGARQGHLAMSKKPPLGHKYFRQLADAYVAAGLAPQTTRYQFPGVTFQGKHRHFYLNGRMKELFLDAFRIKWHLHHGTHPPVSELVMEHEDKCIRHVDHLSIEGWKERLAKMPVPTRMVEPDPHATTRLTAFNQANALLEHHADGTFTLYQGKENEPWRIENAAKLDAVLQALQLPRQFLESIRSKNSS